MKQLAGVNLEQFLQDISRLPGALADAVPAPKPPAEK